MPREAKETRKQEPGRIFFDAQSSEVSALATSAFQSKSCKLSRKYSSQETWLLERSRHASAADQCPLLGVSEYWRNNLLFGDGISSVISDKRLDDFYRFLWLRPHRVVGIGLGVSDYAAAVDHEACGHRELPR